MARQRKIKRNVKIYQSTQSKGAKKIWTVLAVIVLVFLGYISAGPILELFSGNNTDSDIDASDSTTSDVSDNSDDTSDDVSDEDLSSSESDDTSSSDDIDKDDTQNQDAELLNSYTMTAKQVLDFNSWQDYIDTVLEQGYDSVIVELKDEDGMIYYSTEVEDAVTCLAVSEGSVDLQELYTTIQESGLTPIAKINTLKDKTVAHASRNNAYTYGTTTSTTWLDNSASSGGKAWLNPYTDNAREYIVELCTEISSMGFETIILDTIQFPDGNMSQINFVDEFTTKAGVLSQLIEEVNTAIAQNGAVAIPEVGIEAYIGVDDLKYGGSPSDFVGESVVINFNYSELSTATLPDDYKDLSFKDDFVEIIEKLFTDIHSTSENIIVVIDSQLDESVAQELMQVLENLGINQVITA